MQDHACLLWDVNPVMFKIWVFSPRWYGFMFGMGLVIGFYLVKWQLNRAKYDEEMPVRLFFYVYLGTLVGAFLGHRIFYDFQAFVRDPISALSIRGGISGLSSHGAAIGILICVWIFHKRNYIRFVEILDRLSFSIAVVATCVRAGNLMNSEIVGRETDVPWAFCFPRYDHGAFVPRHPSQIYEIGIGLFVLGALVIADKRLKGEERPLGFLSGVFMITYFSLRFVVEFFKEYQALPSGYPLTMGQFLSIPFVIAGILTIWWAVRANHRAA